MNVQIKKTYFHLWVLIKILKKGQGHLLENDFNSLTKFFLA